MNSDKLSAQAILSQLFQLLDQNATGTFLVTTSDKKALHAILENGILTGCSYAQQYGIAALESIGSVSYGSCKFIKNRLLPVLPHARIDQSHEIQDVLNTLRDQHLIIKSDLNPESDAEPEIEALSDYIEETTEIFETLELLDDWDYLPQSISDINPVADLSEDDAASVWNWFRKVSRKKSKGDTCVIESRDKVIKEIDTQDIHYEQIIKDTPIRLLSEDTTLKQSQRIYRDYDIQED